MNVPMGALLPAYRYIHRAGSVRAGEIWASQATQAGTSLSPSGTAHPGATLVSSRV